MTKCITPTPTSSTAPDACFGPMLVSRIQGYFWVPGYQRGYRWGKEEVVQLLNDLDERVTADRTKEDYYLQPVVVKKKTDSRYELIDGQQRLTTLYLIYKALRDLMGDLVDACPYEIDYETRPDTPHFLKDPLNAEKAKENIDFHYLKEAYVEIDGWLRQKEHTKAWLMKFYPFLQEHLRIIWYEVPQERDSVALFTRLNNGRIPLTNAELVRALIFRGETTQTKLEWAFRWDRMEEHLQNDLFWGFVSNQAPDSYPNRVELVFDLISGKAKKAHAPDTYTFDYFYAELMERGQEQTALWKKIWETYVLLAEWFADRVLYHKVGYLVAVGIPLHDLIALYRGDGGQPCNKKAFNALLDEKIRTFLQVTEAEVLNLSYGNGANDRKKISHLLLLFNVLTTMEQENDTQLFPFWRHKGREWSLEHIHAQQDAGLKKEKDWNEWARLYVSILENILANPDSFFPLEEELEIGRRLIEAKKEIAARLHSELSEKAAKGLSREDYLDLSARVLDFFNDTDQVEIHLISNLALLSIADNATFNNAPFPLKRARMLELDKAGRYIPLCTRRIFLKYYTAENENQLLRWTSKDREHYQKAILEKIKAYFVLKTNRDGKHVI